MLGSASEEAFDRFTRLVSRVLDVPVALVSLVDDQRVFFKSAVGLAEPWATQREAPLTHSFCPRVVLSERPVVIPDAPADEHLCDSPAISALGMVAYAGMPLRGPDGSTLGSLCAVDHAPRSWSNSELASLSDLAAAVNGEIALRVALARQGAARRVAERAGQRLEFLAQASALLGSSLDYGRTLEAVARLAVPAFANWCLVHLRSADGGLVRAALTGSDPEIEDRLRHRHTRQRSDFPEARIGPAQVARSGEAELVTSISEDMLLALARDEEQLAELRRLGITSLVMAPLIARQQRIGVMTFVSTSPERQYNQRDLRFLEDLASRCAAAIDNARLYQERDTIARALQATLLPPQLPEIHGMEVGASYLPFGTGAQVGGDFYDVFELESGRWLLVLGDVSGKGPLAASLTGLARHTLRAAAVHHEAPSALLAALNEALLVGTQELDAERFCTVACLRVELGGHGARISAASAGHPPPVRLHADGRVEPLRCEGPALGLLETVAIADVRIDIEADDHVVMYTDGVTESRHAQTGEQYGTGRVEELLSSCAELGAQEVADRLGQGVLDWQGGTARDDIAILVLKVVPRRPATPQPSSGTLSR